MIAWMAFPKSPDRIWRMGLTAAIMAMSISVSEALHARLLSVSLFATFPRVSHPIRQSVERAVRASTAAAIAAADHAVRRRPAAAWLAGAGHRAGRRAVRRSRI